MEKVITLKKPIELKKKETGEVLETIPKVTVREPDFGDLMDALDDCPGKEVPKGRLIGALVGACTGLTPDMVRRLSMADGFAVTEAVTDFLPAGLLTGKGLLS